MPTPIKEYILENPQYAHLDPYEVATMLYDSYPELKDGGVSFDVFANELGAEDERLSRLPQRGYIGETLAAVPRTLRTGAALGLKALHEASEGAGLPEFTRPSEEYIADVEQELSDPNYAYAKGRKAEEPGLYKNLIEGAETAGVSMMAMAPGMIAGGIKGAGLGPVGAAVGMAGGAALSGGVPFALAEHYDFMQEAHGLLDDIHTKRIMEEQGADEETARELAYQETEKIASIPALKSAFYEGAGEAASDALDALIFRGGGKFLKKVLTKSAEASLKKRVAEALARYALNTGLVAGAEMPAEAFTGYGEAKARAPIYEAAGQTPPDPMEWAKLGAKGAAYAAPFFGGAAMIGQKIEDTRSKKQAEFNTKADDARETIVKMLRDGVDENGNEATPEIVLAMKQADGVKGTELEQVIDEALEIHSRSEDANLTGKAAPLETEETVGVTAPQPQGEEIAQEGMLPPAETKIPAFSSTGDAVKFGKTATDEQKTELKRLVDLSRESASRLSESGNLDEAGKHAFRAQLYNEALQASEGKIKAESIGEAVEPKKLAEPTHVPGVQRDELPQPEGALTKEQQKPETPAKAPPAPVGEAIKAEAMPTQGVESKAAAPDTSPSLSKKLTLENSGGMASPGELETKPIKADLPSAGTVTPPSEVASAAKKEEPKQKPGRAWDGKKFRPIIAAKEINRGKYKGWYKVTYPDGKVRTVKADAIREMPGVQAAITQPGASKESGVVKGSGKAESKAKPTTKNEQYSTTPSTGEAVTAEAIKSMPVAKSWSISEKGGKIHVKTRGAYGFTIETVDNVTPDEIAFKAGYGRLAKPGEAMSGKYGHKTRTVTIVKGKGDKWTVGHEFMHFLEKSGIIGPVDVDVLKNKIRKLAKQGKFEPVNQKDIGGEEDRARYVEKVLYDRAQPGIIRKIVQKIADALDSFVNLFTRTARGVVRGVESGKVMEQKQGVTSASPALAYAMAGRKAKGADTVPMYSTVTRQENGKRLVSEALQKSGMSKKDADARAEEIDKEYTADFPKVTADTAKGFINIIKRLWADRGRKKGRETWLDRMISLPAFWKHPRLQKLYHEAGLQWMDDKETYFHDITHIKKDGKEINLVQPQADLEKNNPKAFKTFMRYIHNIDITGVGWKVKQNPESGKWEIRNPKKEVVFSSEDEREAVGKMYEMEAAEYGKKHPEAANALLNYRLMADALHEVYAQPMRDIIADSEKNGEPIPEITVQDEDGNTVSVNLKVVLAELGDLRGTYMPRMRKPGTWKVVAEKKGDETKRVFRTAGNKVSAHTMAEALKRDGYEILEVGEIQHLGEDVYELAGSTLGIQEILNQALKNMGAGAVVKMKDLGLKGSMIENEDGSKKYVIKGSLYKRGQSEVLESLGGKYVYDLKAGKGTPQWVFEDPPDDIEQRVEQGLFKTAGIPSTSLKQLFATQLARSAAGVIQQHGARSRMLRRNKGTGEDVWLGYETNPTLAITAASKIAAGMRAKHDFAIRALDIISGTDVKWSDYKETEPEKAKAKKLRVEVERLQAEMNLIKKNHFDKIKPEVADIKKQIEESNDATEKDKLKIRLDKLKSLPEKWHGLRNKIAELRGGGVYADYQELVNKNKIDAARDPEEFLQATTYFKDMLRNDDKIDRAIATLRGLAVLKYLAFRPAAAVVNFTALATSFPASMSKYANIPIHRALDLLPRAMNQYWDYFRGKSQEKWTKAALDEIHRRGWHNPQYNKEALSYLQGRLGRGWRRFTDAGMAMFGTSERINRVSSILATYQGIRSQHKGKWTDANHLDALEKAKEVSDMAHGTYSKANYPHLARGDNAAAQTVRTFYVFKTFQHNYLLNMRRMGFGKESLYMALSPAILAGAGASVLTPLVSKMLSMAGLGGDDPEEELYRYVEKTFGDDAENFARFGLAGLAGVSLKGSLATDFGIPMTIGDVLGAPGSLISDTVEGGKLLLRGDYMKGFEKATPINALGSMVRAYRESHEGVTTYGNAPKFYGNEPIVADTVESIYRFLAFSPARLIGISERQWKERNIESKMKDRRDGIYARIKKYRHVGGSKAEWIDVLRMIEEYNEAASKSIVPGMKKITKKSIKASLKRAFKPSKKERERE